MCSVLLIQSREASRLPAGVAPQNTSSEILGIMQLSAAHCFIHFNGHPSAIHCLFITFPFQSLIVSWKWNRHEWNWQLALTNLTTKHIADIQQRMNQMCYNLAVISSTTHFHTIKRPHERNTFFIARECVPYELDYYDVNIDVGTYYGIWLFSWEINVHNVSFKIEWLTLGRKCKITQK